MSLLENELKEEIFIYLDALRVSGVVNMFGATPYITAEYDLNRTQAKSVLMDWMATFADRHPEG